MSVSGDVAPRPTRLGRYELITRIGQGGMADVQLALQRGPAGFEKLVVVKLVHENLATQKAFVDMLLDEARVAALVKHPNVVDIYDLGQADGRFFIAMEYLEGEPLLAVLRAGREGKRLDPLSTGRLIADTAEGLDAAHELRSMSGEPLELVHHDISLGNIVVLYNGQAKLVDFGVAKASQSASTRTKVQGKFSYMAPEKLRGAIGDRRSDIFSLGCVMWEALTLKRLFKANNDSETMNQILEMTLSPPSRVNGDVPPEYDAVVMKALERDPERRHRTAKELANEIEEILRKRGYGAKNDRVARWMQETFKDHIDARKSLLQEVVAKGSASAEVLDAAFKPVLAAGTDHIRRDPSEFAMASGSLPPIQAGLEETVMAPPAFEDAEPASEPGIDRMKQIALLASGAGVLVMLLVVIVAAAAHGGDGASVAAVASGSGEGPRASNLGPRAQSPAPAPGSAVGSAEIEMQPDPNVGSAMRTAGSAHDSEPEALGPRPEVPTTPSKTPPTPKVDRKPAPSPDTLRSQALQAYVKGDFKTALSLAQKSKAADSRNAATWRLLGKIYEKLGERGAAKTAYRRYLTLAPGAPDAAQIRESIEKP